MDETTIKTNLGLILQAVLGEAIQRAGYGAIQNYQYHPTCEKPDFLVPDEKSPRYMLEVHQTEARNSFQMKTLRAFTAVTEAKAFYGNRLVAVNVLFGDPSTEVPASNVRALCGVFDVNLVPRRDSEDKAAVVRLEKAALALASDEDYQKKTVLAASEIALRCPDAINTLGEMLKKAFGSAAARSDLFPLWEAERTRAARNMVAPLSGVPTYYKRGLLGSLFLSDEHFREVSVSGGDVSQCSSEACGQLFVAGLATVEENIDGDVYTLDPHFASFLQLPDAGRMRQICISAFSTTPDLNWFFADIRDQQRRIRMARIFLRELKKGKAAFKLAFSKTFRSSNAFGVQHSRCWIADLMPLVVGRSHNYFNRAIYSHPRYTINLGNPYNNIAIRSPRLGQDEKVLKLLEALACEVFFSLIAAAGIEIESLDAGDVADQLLRFRLDAAIKLRKLDPLLLVVAAKASEFGLRMSVAPIRNVISDLAGAGGAGVFRIAFVQPEGQDRVVLVNAVAVHEGNGDHKSKEWGARRLATLYRMKDGTIGPSEYSDGLFVLDGEWEDKDVERLYRAGWTHICRLGDLEKALQKVFDVKGNTKVLKVAASTLLLEEEDDNA